MPNNKSQSKSNNLASVNAKISALKVAVSPTIKVTPVRGNPRALVRTRDRWIQQSVRITQSITSGTSIVLGAIVAELGITDVVQVKVRGIRIWNATGPRDTTNYVFAETAAVLTTSSVRCEAQDYGSGSQLAGLAFHIPSPLQASNGASALQQTQALYLAPSATATTTSAQTIVMDWDILWNTTADGS